MNYSMRRATSDEQRRYGVQWRTTSTWREQPSVEAQANSVRKKIGRKRNKYIAEYAQMLGIGMKEAKARISSQKQPPHKESTATRESGMGPVSMGPR